MKIWYDEQGKAVTRPLSLIIDGKTYVPPTDDQLFMLGYTYKDTSRELSYEDTVAALIRKKYSINDELAILRQKEVKPEEFEEYNLYCEECKSKAKIK